MSTPLFNILPDPPDDDAIKWLLARLNSGPDNRQLVNERYRHLFPADWRLSYRFVAPTALGANAAALSALAVTAFDEFEGAAAALLASRPDIREMVLAGVETDPSLQEAYLSSRTGPFNLRRLDVVVEDATTVTVSESDEMPGGLTEAYHLDRAYGINQARWTWFLENLTAHGPLVFVVSDDWSQVYADELAWMVSDMSARGYSVYLVRGDEASYRLKLATYDRKEKPYVVIDGQHAVGTIWRLFPVFEARGRLAELVQAAHAGYVRMMPQFASWGNKAWFAVFWQEQAFFRQTMPEASFQLLQRTIPYSVMLDHPYSRFPLEMQFRDGSQLTIGNFDELGTLPNRDRKRLVVKVSGANRYAARSYGVLLGDGVSATEWRNKLAELAASGLPILVQEFRSPGRLTFPVVDVLDETRRVVSQPRRVLLRPWAVEGSLLSCQALALPETTKRLHGTTHSCHVPANLG